MERLSGLLGIITILALAHVFSADRKAIRIKTVVWGLGLQFALALFVLRTTAGVSIFRWTGEEINRLLSFAHDGSTFVFGQLGRQGITVAVFAFRLLPILFLSA